jgi:S-adenosylmethionine/arginine decarboxylase-like enzyme
MESRFLTDPESLRVLLRDFVKYMGFHAFGDPSVHCCPFPTPSGAALSAVVFLGESSITVHTYPEHSAVFIDVFHCRDFSPSKAFWRLVEGFYMDMEQVSVKLLRRGISEDGVPIETCLDPWFVSWPVEKEVKVGGT